MALGTENAGVNSPRNPGVRQANSTTLRPAAAPTASYVASSHANVVMGRLLTLLFDIVQDSMTAVAYYVEWSHDGTNWFRSTNVAAAAGTNTLTENENVLAVSANIKIADTMQVQAPFVRVQVKATGVIGNETVAVDAITLTD